MIFVLQSILCVFLVVFAAYLIEKAINLRNHARERILSTRKIALIGLFSAVSAILMTLEIPVPFAPPFYKIDLSEIPVLIIVFAYGPVAGVLTEFIKVLLKLVLKSTSTAFVGELANFAVGSSMVLPAGIVYLIHKTKHTAKIACAVGVLCMTCFGSMFNAIYLLPKFSEIYGIPLDAIIAMGTAVNPAIHSVGTMALFAVAPLNLLKGLIDTVITMFIYKRLSPFLKREPQRR